jgi:hypothetical protein
MPAGATPIPARPNLTVTGLVTVSPLAGEIISREASLGAAVTWPGMGTSALTNTGTKTNAATTAMVRGALGYVKNEQVRRFIGIFLRAVA